KTEFIDVFARELAPGNILMMPEPVYYGGTTDRSVGSADIVQGVRDAGHDAMAFATRDACVDALLHLAQAGDRIVVMGARDDTLATFAAELVDRLKQR